jgi:hypothetical protein
MIEGTVLAILALGDAQKWSKVLGFRKKTRLEDLLK